MSRQQRPPPSVAPHQRAYPRPPPPAQQQGAATGSQPQRRVSPPRREPAVPPSRQGQRVGNHSGQEPPARHGARAESSSHSSFISARSWQSNEILSSWNEPSFQVHLPYGADPFHWRRYLNWFCENHSLLAPMNYETRAKDFRGVLTIRPHPKYLDNSPTSNGCTRVVEIMMNNGHYNKGNDNAKLCFFPKDLYPPRWISDESVKARNGTC